MLRKSPARSWNSLPLFLEKLMRVFVIDSRLGQPDAFILGLLKPDPMPDGDHFGERIRVGAVF